MGAPVAGCSAFAVPAVAGTLTAPMSSFTVNGTGRPRHGEYVVDGWGDVAVDRTRRILGPDGHPTVGELGSRAAVRARS
jgi:hypothetical protein